MNRQDSQWVRPGPEDRRPVWGLRGGIQVGLWPASLEGSGAGGPRGLLRVGYPVLGSPLLGDPLLGGPQVGLVNFIAVEPTVGGRRGFSEMERGDSDGAPGRAFWTGQAGGAPDPGTVRTVGGAERLAVRVHVERFDNGAKPVVDLEIRADRPGELRLTVSSAPGGARMDECVLTATMGNYARLRRLWLREGALDAGAVWPGFAGDGFTEEAFYPCDRLVRLPGGGPVVCATSDEADPRAAPPDPAAPRWAYRGGFSPTQYWRKPGGGDADRLRVRVNGRRLYWGTRAPIPGGLAFENFDLVEPFSEGQAFVFGLTRRPPADVARGLIT